jgi:hypothetical protein
MYRGAPAQTSVYSNVRRAIPPVVTATGLPLGSAIPADGTLVMDGLPGGKAYLVSGGQLHWIPNPETFNAMGFSWSSVQNLGPAGINAIPEGAPLPSVAIPSAAAPGSAAAAAAAPSSQIAVAAAPVAAAAPSWFTDPAQALITGLPNWGLFAAAAGLFFLMGGKRR